MYVGSHNDEVVDEDGLHGLIVSLANMGAFWQDGHGCNGAKKVSAGVATTQGGLGLRRST